MLSFIRNYAIIIFLLMVYLEAQAQEIKVEVASQKDKQPIPLTTILFLKNDSIVGGLYTNEQGKATFTLEPEVTHVEFQSVGYDILEIEAKNLSAQIYLQESITNLNEVVLNPTKVATRFLGSPAKRTINRYSLPSGLETVTYIENPLGEEKWIKSFSFFLYNRNDVVPVVRLIFYTTKDGLPYKNYLEDTKMNTFVLDSDNKGKITLDIQKLNLMLPKEGLFVGLEYLGILNKDTKELIRLKLSDHNDSNRIYISMTSTKNKTAPKTYSGSRFRWVDFYDSLYTDEIHTPSFKIEVFE